MSKIFAIIGKSYSGKDTLLNYILEDCESFCKDNNLHELVRYTTRKPRPNEVEGKDYYFIDNEQYEKFKDNKNAVINTYHTEFGDWHYITDFSSLDVNKNYIMTSDILDIPKYKKILGDNLCVIYLVPPHWKLFERFSKRDDNSSYNDKKYQEIYRRFIDDLYKFGSRSNDCLANTTCIINVGQIVMYHSIRMQIIKFINGNNESVILNYGNMNPLTVINTNYEPEINYRTESFIYSNAIKFSKIIMCNDSLNIYTEEESFKYKK